MNVESLKRVRTLRFAVSMQPLYELLLLHSSIIKDSLLLAGTRELLNAGSYLTLWKNDIYILYERKIIINKPFCSPIKIKASGVDGSSASELPHHSSRAHYRARRTLFRRRYESQALSCSFIRGNPNYR